MAAENLDQMDLVEDEDLVEEQAMDRFNSMDSEFANSDEDSGDAADADFDPEDDLYSTLAQFKTPREFSGSINRSRGIIAQINTDYDNFNLEGNQQMTQISDAMDLLETRGADISGADNDDPATIQYNALYEARECIKTLARLRKSTVQVSSETMNFSLQEWIIAAAEGNSYKYHAVRDKKHEIKLLKIKETAKAAFDDEQLELKKQALQEKMQADVERLEKKHAAAAGEGSDSLSKRAKPSSRSGRGRGRGRALYKPPGRRWIESNRIE